ncbi:MAG: helix-turn-helix domain-containing protein [Acidobacteriia bacterium]|nr:helix-turn-helix domain-containing protein [Terriglobia bacterium]
MPNTATAENATREGTHFASNPSTQPPDRLITVSEFADTVGLNKISTYGLIRQGKIPAVHIGRSIRISTHALDKWIASGGCR